MKEIILTQGKVAIVDDDAFERLSSFTWCAVKAGSSETLFYARRSERIDGKTKNFYMHHEILGFGKRVDHIDGNALNNQSSNLRECTHSQNMQNRSKKTAGTSKYKGVQWWKTQNMWAVRIAKNGKRFLVGYFTEEIEAAKAYNKAASQLFGEFAKLNEI